MGETPTLAQEPGADTATEAPAEEADVQAAVEEANDDQGDKTDVNEQTVELEDDDFTGDNGLFSGIEDSENNTTDTASATPDSEGEDSEESDEEEMGMAGLDGNAEALEDAINEGAARLGVVGLTDDDFDDSGMTRDDLEIEFAETFAAFRLGYFGSQTIDKYVLQPADGDVNPAWGMAGAALMATAMVVWMRPDGDEQMAAARSAVEGLAGGDE